MLSHYGRFISTVEGRGTIKKALIETRRRKGNNGFVETRSFVSDRSD